MSHGHKKALKAALAATCLAAGIGAATSAMATDTLIVNQYIKPNQYLASADGSHRLIFQPDGNLVLQRQSDMTQLWSTNTGGQNGQRLVLGADGNLTVQTYGKAAAWTSNTRGNRVSRLTLRNDGNLVMVDTANKEVWATGTKAAQDVSALATVTYVSSSGRSLKDSNATMTIARPANVQANDMLYLVIVVGPNGGQVPSSAGTGWTLVSRCTVTGNNDTACATNGTDLGIAVFRRRAATSDPANFTINKSAGYTTLASIFAMRSVGSTSAVSRFFDNGSGALEFQTTCKGLTGTAGSINVCVMAHDDSQTFTTPTNWTNRRTVFADDSGLLIYTRGGGTTVGDTTFNYDVDRSPESGNAINFSFQVRP